MAYVYITTNKINGKKYIGVVATNNHKKKENYLGSGVALKKSIEKYGKDNFEKEIIKEFDNNEEARSYEKYLINELNAKSDKNYYNMCDGGYGGGVLGHKVTDETKCKISKTLSGRKRPEISDKLSKHFKGYVWSDEVIESRVKGIKEYYKNAKEEDLKRRWTKISESHKGKSISDETKEKLSKINSKLSDKEVLEIDKMIKDGINYKVISKIFNISPSQISSIKHRKTYKWLWVD